LQNTRLDPIHLHEAIVNAYLSGGYIQKKIGDYFGLHYSQISRIIAKYKT
jgi:transposase